MSRIEMHMINQLDLMKIKKISLVQFRQFFKH
jgi:hypothetical protein